MMFFACTLDFFIMLSNTIMIKDLKAMKMVISLTRSNVIKRRETKQKGIIRRKVKIAIRVRVIMHIFSS